MRQSSHGDLVKVHALATSVVRPGLVVTDDSILYVTVRAGWGWLFTSTLASIATEITDRPAEAVLR